MSYLVPFTTRKISRISIPWEQHNNQTSNRLIVPDIACRKQNTYPPGIVFEYSQNFQSNKIPVTNFPIYTGTICGILVEKALKSKSRKVRLIEIAVRLTLRITGMQNTEFLPDAASSTNFGASSLPGTNHHTCLPLSWCCIHAAQQQLRKHRLERCTCI